MEILRIIKVEDVLKYAKKYWFCAKHREWFDPDESSCSKCDRHIDKKRTKEDEVKITSFWELDGNLNRNYVTYTSTSSIPIGDLFKY